MTTWEDADRISQNLGVSRVKAYLYLVTGSGNRRTTYKMLAAEERGRRHNKWWSFMLLPLLVVIIVSIKIGEFFSAKPTLKHKRQP